MRRVYVHQTHAFADLETLLGHLMCGASTIGCVFAVGRPVPNLAVSTIVTCRTTVLAERAPGGIYVIHGFHSAKGLLGAGAAHSPAQLGRINTGN